MSEEEIFLEKVFFSRKFQRLANLDTKGGEQKKQSLEIFSLA